MMNLKSEIQELLLETDLNSPTVVTKLQELNTTIAESELDLPQIKHLPTTLRGTLETLLSKVK